MVSGQLPMQHYSAQMQGQYQQPAAAAQQQQQQQQQQRQSYLSQPTYAQPTYSSQQHNHAVQYQQSQPQAQPLHHQAHQTHQPSPASQYPYQQQQQQQAQNTMLSNVQQHTRRSPSVATFSTSSSVPPPAAYRTSPTIDVRRSTSSRSGSSIHPQQNSSYVALLRRQKATVWSDMIQMEDPNAVAQRRRDKMRATLEVAGGQRYSSSLGTGRTSTGISATGKVAAKIRHHGKPTVTGFTASENHVGVGGVPVRLSATEVEGESSGEEDDSLRLNHRRTGSSGRNSIGSARRVSYRPSGTFNSRRWSPGNTPERAGSLMEEPTEGISVIMAAVSLGDETASIKAHSTHSGSSEKADNLGELDEMPKLATKSQQHATLKREKSVNTTEDLKRRGSVDERTMTLTSGRLYIANPD
ncbi:hypothetical protein CFO_g3247 [Ceratocystis platani]|uniref:Uncharacterized protein n=1 Tax=Ceratocystis fimbriata f. sp. platani TaxID=88771 RepID=A0A0F8B0D9_CERFI|nr:hypothetical protein CFO_g3247 [Ceratocystis platani]